MGQWNNVISSGVTVDTSAPIVTPPWVEGTTDHTHSLALRWEPVRECESNVARVEWGLGSRPGSSDLLEWSVARTEEISGTTSVVESQDGQLVFLSVKVISVRVINGCENVIGWSRAKNVCYMICLS